MASHREAGDWLLALALGKLWLCWASVATSVNCQGREIKHLPRKGDALKVPFGSTFFGLSEVW